MRAVWTMLAVVLVALPALPAPAPEGLYTTLDRMYIRPGLPLTPVNPSARLDLSLYHCYPTALHHLRLIPESRYLTVTSTPREIPVLKPTTIVKMALDLTIRDSPPGQAVKLRLGVAADEISSPARYEVQIPLTKIAAERLNAGAAVPLGSIEVRVRRYGNALFLVYLIPTLALIAWVAWRKWRAG